MYNKRHVLPISLFTGLNLFMIVGSITLGNIGAKKWSYSAPAGPERTALTNVSYFSLKKGKANTDFLASSLRIEEKKFFIKNPIGHTFNKKDQVIDFQGQSGEFDDATRQLWLNGKVLIKSEGAQHRSKKFFYNGKKEFLEARGAVESIINDDQTGDIIEVAAHYLSSWVAEERLLYIGGVVGELKRKRRYESGVNFSARRLEMKMAESLILLNDDVHIKRNNYDLRSRRGEIFLENYNKKLKYFVLYDDIKLVEELKLAGGKKQVRKAFSEKLENSISEGKIILTGAPRVEQGLDVIKGYQITLKENVEIVEVDDARSSFQFKKEE